MSKSRTQYIAQCPKTKQFYLMDSEKNQVINFQDLSNDQAEKIGGSSSWNDIVASPDLRSCQWCGSRKVGGCNCQEAHGKCPPTGQYSFQCLFCKQLHAVSNVRASDVRNLRLSVTAKHWDDIGPLLTNMGLRTSSFAQTGFDCDILFINCGTSDFIDPYALKNFVLQGGCVYASDLAISHIINAFPASMKCDHVSLLGNFRAHIVDKDLASIIGDRSEITFDMERWARILQHQGNCLIKGDSQTLNNPLMITFTEGKGRVYYTSFHNHAQASEKEHAVLKAMLLKQIGDTVHQSISQVGEVLGLNIADLSNIAKGGVPNR